MHEVTIELSAEAVEAIMWAANRDPEKPMTVEAYISFVMEKAAESYVRQAEAVEIDRLGKEALSEAKLAGTSPLSIKQPL